MRLAVLAGIGLIVLFMSLPPPVGASGRQGFVPKGPRALWNAYPLGSNHSTSSGRLPVAVSTPRPPPALAQASSGGGGFPIVIVPIALLMLAGGAVLGSRWSRRASPPEVAVARGKTSRVRPRTALRRPGVPRVSLPRPSVPRLNVPRLSPPRLSIPRLSLPHLSPPRLSLPRLHRTTAAPSAPAPARQRPWDGLPPLFERVPWPEDAEERWRCAIVWASGYRRSRFRAQVTAPGRRRRQPIASTEAFSWMLRADPDPSGKRFRAPLGALIEELEDAGWEPVEPGEEWWNERFVWLRPDPPPPLIGAAGKKEMQNER